VPVGGPFKANNSEVLRAAIVGGIGIGLVPDFSASAELESGAMIPVLQEWRPVGFFGDRIYAVRPGGGRASRALECTIEHLRQAFASG
jgi:DNA-binding transcriptional LysR family regulator